MQFHGLVQMCYLGVKERLLMQCDPTLFFQDS